MPSSLFLLPLISVRLPKTSQSNHEFFLHYSSLIHSYFPLSLSSQFRFLPGSWASASPVILSLSFSSHIISTVPWLSKHVTPLLKILWTSHHQERDSKHCRYAGPGNLKNLGIQGIWFQKKKKKKKALTVSFLQELPIEFFARSSNSAFTRKPSQIQSSEVVISPLHLQPFQTPFVKSPSASLTGNSYLPTRSAPPEDSKFLKEESCLW